MRVDGVVDQRLDPYSSTEAAANLMLYNYRLLGSWPLAVTAYNHGPGGLRRAQEELRHQRYRGDREALPGCHVRLCLEEFLRGVSRGARGRSQRRKIFRSAHAFAGNREPVVTLPDYIGVDALARAFKADLGALRVLNPALRPPVWNKTRLVPRGYALRIPGSPPAADIAAAWARLPRRSVLWRKETTVNTECGAARRWRA